MEAYLFGPMLGSYGAVRSCSQVPPLPPLWNSQWFQRLCRQDAWSWSSGQQLLPKA